MGHRAVLPVARVQVQVQEAGVADHLAAADQEAAFNLITTK